MEKIAKLLLKISAIDINTKQMFTWASGIKSPIYVDNRIINSFVEQRNEIEKEFAKKILEVFPECEAILGVATGGISHAAYVSTINKLPMGYIRTSAKDHGKQNQIEGKITKQTKVVIIEDLFSTGRSSYKAYEIAKNSGLNVLGIASIFSYNLPLLKEQFKDVKHFSLTNIDEVVKVAIEENMINQEDIKIIKDFIERLGKK